MALARDRRLRAAAGRRHQASERFRYLLANRSGPMDPRSSRAAARDIYSFTRTGEPWTSSSWLAQVLFARSYRIAGWTGPIVLASTCIAATFALLAWILGRRI